MVAISKQYILGNYNQIGKAISHPAKRDHGSEEKVAVTLINPQINQYPFKKPNPRHYNCWLFASGPSETSICISWPALKASEQTYLVLVSNQRRERP